MKRKIVNFLVVIATLSIVSCSSSSPEDVAKDFYNYLNTGNVEKAKNLASPSAKDYIDKLASLDIFKTKGDSLPIELLEIKKPENPKEGDTSIVNYKIGEFKGKLNLVYNDKRWNVIFDENLKQTRLIEMTSEHFYLSWFNDKNVFWENYNGCRFRIKSLLCFQYANNYNLKGFAFDKKNMSIILQGNSFTSKPLTNVFFCNKKLQRKGLEKESEFLFSGSNAFEIESFTSEKQRQKLIKNKELKNERNYYDIYFQSSFDLEGEFTGYEDGVVYINNCQITITEKCN